MQSYIKRISYKKDALNRHFSNELNSFIAVLDASSLNSLKVIIGNLHSAIGMYKTQHSSTVKLLKVYVIVFLKASSVTFAIF
jgi:hypothetical protein